MLAIAVIVFREVLEAALIISIVLAASLGVPRRGRFVSAGVAGGVLGAGLVALFAAGIAETFAGSGQELLNAGVLILAVCMLAWHNIWMSRHAREIASDAKALGHDVATGARPLAALALVTGAAVLREGSETVLFAYGVATSSPEGPLSLLGGGLLGLAGGILVGTGMYAGLLRIPVRHLFTVTGWLVLLLAAGLASQAAGFLVQADLLPSLGNSIWDTSFLLTENSVVGRVLHTLIGYTARPQGIQLIAYLATLAAIGIPMRALGRPRHAVPVIVLIAVGAIAWPRSAAADLKVRMPTVEYRELELEHNGLLTFGKRDTGFDRAQSYTTEIEYGLTPWWQIGLESEFFSGAGRSLTMQAVTLENTFQITEPGQYYFNLGFFAEYGHVLEKGNANGVTFGPIIQKELPNVLGVDTLHTLNVFFTRDIGAYASRATGLDMRWQSVALLHPLLSPGVEYYGAINDLGHAKPYNQQEALVGPVLTGQHRFQGFGKIKYEVGYLVGLTSASPTSAVRWRLEYELAF